MAIPKPQSMPGSKQDGLSLLQRSIAPLCAHPTTLIMHGPLVCVLRWVTGLWRAFSQFDFSLGLMFRWTSGASGWSSCCSGASARLRTAAAATCCASSPSHRMRWRSAAAGLCTTQTAERPLFAQHFGVAFAMSCTTVSEWRTARHFAHVLDGHTLRNGGCGPAACISPQTCARWSMLLTARARDRAAGDRLGRFRGAGDGDAGVRRAALRDHQPLRQPPGRHLHHLRRRRSRRRLTRQPVLQLALPRPQARRAAVTTTLGRQGPGQARARLAVRVRVKSVQLAAELAATSAVIRWHLWRIIVAVNRRLGWTSHKATDIMAHQ